MNRTIKDATISFAYFYRSHDQLRSHLQDFVSAYNFAMKAQDPRRPLALTNSGLPGMDFTAPAIQTQPAPANAGTKQLDKYIDALTSDVKVSTFVAGYLRSDLARSSTQ